MLMPSRKYSSGTGYRYGFNGKENDNEVKGEGNQQDYGMRIYDPRLGIFLSVDPIANSYPWYTPYQFAGNDVMRCIDLDGLEPTMRTEKYNDNYKPFIGGDWSIDVYDRTSHQVFQASGIHDPNTGKTYIIADDGQGQNKYFYLVNDDGAIDKIQWKIENGRNVLIGGKFIRYETRNETDAKQGAAIADGIGTTVFAGAVIVAAGAAGAGVEELYGAYKTEKELEKLNKNESPGRNTQSSGNNPYRNQTEKQLRDSKESFEKLIKEHKQKLEDMEKDPIGSTKPDKLKQMTKDNPSKEELMRRINNQKKEVKDQLKKQENELEKINEAIKERKN